MYVDIEVQADKYEAELELQKELNESNNSKNNSVNQMVDALKKLGPLTENEIHKTCFGYDRNTSFGSNKKYADMLRRGLKKGIIDRVETYAGWNFDDSVMRRSRFVYYATKEIKVPCSAELDMQMANESENIQ